MILYLDTETTAARPGQICQLAYVCVSGGSVQGKNYFFAVDKVLESAYRVHGFSKERLDALSGGFTFAAAAQAIKADLEAAAVVVGHNIGADKKFLQAEFERLGLMAAWPPAFCTMRETTQLLGLKRLRGHGLKPPRLSELCAFCGVDEGLLRQCVQTVFGTSAAYHDARADALACKLCVEHIAGLPACPSAVLALMEK